MKLAIHQIKNSFSARWIDYCKENDIPFKIVDCYGSDIIKQLEDCDALMWHFHHANSKDVLFAKQLLYSVQASGKRVFPDFNTVWHFDDKVGQKYLLESLGAPLVASYVFYNKNDAIQWAKSTSYPKVFKLRRGAGAANVHLVKGKNQAIRLTNKAFGSGFRLYDPWGGLKERWRKFKMRKTNLIDLIEGIGRIFIRVEYEKTLGKEKGYIYFQEFIPGNDHDIRIVVIGDKAFAIKRLVRYNDFRASGSGIIYYEKYLFDERVVRLAYELADKISNQCIALDFIRDGDNPLLTEISYGFTKEVYDPCLGYWDKDLKWHSEKFNPYGWMVENLIKDIQSIS